MLFVSLLPLLGSVFGATELLHNSDFENSNFAGNWVCNGCTMHSSSDAYHGSHSVTVSHRRGNWASPKQSVAVTPGHKYAFRAYFKLLNNPDGHMYHNIDLMVEENHGSRRFHLLSRIPMQQVGFGWTEIGGDYTAGSEATKASVYMQVDTSTVNFLFDYATFQEIPSNSNWKKEANAAINSTRKAPISVSIHAPGSEHNLEIDIVQKKSAFAWGTAVDAGIMIDPNMKAYQDFVYDNFEWAVLKNLLKWRLTEWTEGHSNFHKAVQAIAALRARGLSVRGHNMFWGVDGHMPKWLDPKSHTDCVTAMKTRVKNTMSHTRGTLAHWDVTNENLHGDYFERHTGNANISMDEFHWMHQEEPSVKLFLNDYNVVTSSQYTTSYKDQAKLFKDAGVPIYGVGVQSHFHSSNIDMDVLKFRLDKVAEAGLPIWITELTVSEHDENKKAEAIENVLTLYFSHPAVEGVLLWGFWDQHVANPTNAIATGAQITPNAAGVRFLDLIKKSWRTNFTQHVSSGQTAHTTGFKGDYELHIKNNGNVIHTEQFTLESSSKHLNVHLGGTGSSLHVTNIVGK